MLLSKKIVLSTAMLAPAALLFGWMAVGGGARPATGAPVLHLPPDDPAALPQPAAGGTRGPSALAFSADGKRLFVAEQDENDVAVIDTTTGAPIAHIPSGGEQPAAIALAPDGRTLVVANVFSGTVGIVDIESHALRGQVALPGEPSGVAVAPSGIAYVSLGQLDQVAVLDIGKRKVFARIPVGRRPGALLLKPDGGTLLCANRIGGSISIIDAAADREIRRLALPATNIRGIALSPDGAYVYATGQQPHNDVPTDRPEGMWSNVMLSMWLGFGCSADQVLPLDTPERGAADPCGIVVDASGDTAFITLSGTHELLRVPLRAGLPGASGAAPQRRVHVGANPKAIAFRPGGAELWVGNHLGNSMSVLAAGSAPVTPTDSSSSGASGDPAVDRPTLRTIDLGVPTPSPNRRLKGRYLFTSAHIVRGRRFTCDSCHPDGNTDGLSWKLAHVKDPPDVRNTRDLRGGLLLTGPYGWTSREEDFEVFVEDEVSGLLKTRLLRHPEVHALWDLVNETPLPPNPYRGPDGALTESARRGEALFAGQAGCSACHVGEMRGGTSRHAWVGTTPPGLTLDVPHLVGAHESAPYLHDGRAATLEEVFSKYNPERRHGRADTLTPGQLGDLLEYVREL
jgi:YVTN family beta-propeller protein